MFRYLTAATLLLFALASHAQPNTGGPDPINGAPIDGGLTLLAAGGAAFAVRRLRLRRRK